jgi:hypothetical protein
MKRVIAAALVLVAWFSLTERGQIVLRSAASFPTAVKSFTTKTNGSTVQATHVNDLQDEVTALEQDLINGLSRVRLGSSTLTIASDAVTATKSLHAVDTESAAASDNLSTISAGTGVGSGHLLVLYAANAARVVTVKDSVGNITLYGGDFVLDSAKKSLLLRYDGTNWVEVARAAGAYANGLNTFGAAATLGLTDAFALNIKTNNTTALTIDSTQFIDSPTQPRAGVYHSTTQALSDSTDTFVLFDSEDYDVGAMHSTVSNTSRLTVPTGGDGLYLVIAAVAFGSNATGYRQLRLAKNGTALNSIRAQGGTASGDSVIQISDILNLAAADYVEVKAYQTSGGSLNIGNASRSNANQLVIVKLW